MRFEVPQFIEVEDKIFGPFTWKQAVYLAGGGGIAVVLFLVAPFWIFLFFGVPLGILAAALAFYKVNTRPFSVLLEAMYNYLVKNKRYLWRRNRGIVYRNNALPEATLNSAPQQTPDSKQNLNALTRELELAAINKPEE